MSFDKAYKTMMNSSAKEKEITLHDYIDIIYRRKWSIILSFIVVLGSTIYFTLTQPPEYESVSTFIIESTDVVFPGAQAVTMKESARPFEFYKAIIASRSFRNRAAQALVDSCTQYPDPDLEITTGDALALVKNLEISNLQYSDFIELKTKANTPRLAYLLIKVGADILKFRCKEIDQEEFRNVVEFVESQKAVTLSELESVEQALQEFLKKTDTAFLNEEEGGILKQLMSLEELLATTQTEKELSEANLKAYDQRLNQLESQLNENFEQNENPKMKQLRDELSKLDEHKNSLLQELGTNHPKVALVDKDIENKKRELIRNMMASQRASSVVTKDERPLLQDLQERKITEELNIYILENREKYYQKLIENFKKKHPNMMENAIEVVRLNRAKTVQQNLYNFLLEKGEEAKIKAATGTGGIRIVDPPTLPTNPIPPRTKMNLILAVIVGLGLGLGIAFIQEYLDNSIRSNEDVTSYLGIPLMGIVPIIRSQNGFLKVDSYHNGKRAINGLRENYLREDPDSDNHSVLISNLKPKDPFVETYRGLRTNLQFAALDKPIKSIVVTSSNPREGKTVTSANLAISFAEMGLQTVLVDADLRKPQQHKLFQIEKSPGLLECLVNNLDLSQVMHETQIPNLRVIPSGKIPPNPAEVIGSRKMQDLIAQVQQQCDMVIFDTPPVIAVTDPLLLGAHVGGILLVIKFRRTNRHEAYNTLETLRRAKLNVLGAVLNQTLFARGYGYYQYYYQYYYSEDGERKRKKRKKSKGS